MTTLFEFAPTGTITDGTAIPASPSLYDVVDAGVVYDTGIKFKDLAASAEAPNPAGTTVRSLEQTLAAPVLTRRIARVMRVEAGLLSGDFVTLTRWRLGGGAGTVAEVRINSSGKLSLRVGGVQLAQASPTIPWGTWFRYEVDTVDAATDTVELRLYLDAESSVPNQVLGPFTWTGGTFDRIIDGLGTLAAPTTVRVGYAADGDTENPSVTRWAPSVPPPSEGGPATVTPDSGATVEDGQTGSDNAFTVVVPAAAEVGDLALLCLASNTGAGTIPAPPAGWNLFAGFPITVNANVRAWLFWKVLAAGEPGSTVTFTLDTGGLRTVGVIECWDWGTGTPDALNVASVVVSAAATGHAAPALASLEIGEAVQAFWVGRIGVAAPSPTLTPPGTHTALRTSKTNAAASPNISVASTRRTATAAAVGEAEGGVTGTWSTATSGMVILVGIRPGAAPSTTPEGIRLYLVTAGGEVQLTSTGIV